MDFSFRNFSKRIESLGWFLVELVLYAGFVSAYFFLVLHFLGGWISQVFEDNKTLYAIVALTLITGQGSLFEMLTSKLSGVIQRTQSIIPPLRRLGKPHETIIRPANVPGLLVYRFAGPLLFFNTTYFAHRVRDLIDTGAPQVTFFLVNAEAIVDMDMTGVEILEELRNDLENKNIALGLCEVKGHFQDVLMESRLFPRLVVYPSVAAAVRDLSKEQPKKETNDGGV